MKRGIFGFSLVEILVTVTIVIILSVVALLIVKPLNFLGDSSYAVTVASLKSIANAANLYAEETGVYPADVNRDIPREFIKYLNPGAWPAGPFTGSVYDWDNWTGQTCWDGTPGGIQITLRQINNYKGKTNYTLYWVMKGPGMPHCNDSSVRGECLNCISRYP